MRGAGTVVLDDDESDDPDNNHFRRHTSPAFWRGGEFAESHLGGSGGAEGEVAGGGRRDGSAGVGVVGLVGVVVGRFWEGVVAPLLLVSSDEDDGDEDDLAYHDYGYDYGYDYRRPFEGPSRYHRSSRTHIIQHPTTTRHRVFHGYPADAEYEARGRSGFRYIMAGTKAESSSRRESKSHKREKSTHRDETPEGREERRAERRRRKEAKDNRKAMEAAALGLGMTRAKGKGKEKAKVKEVEPKENEEEQPQEASSASAAPPAKKRVTVDEVINGLTRSKSTGASAAPASGRQVRDKPKDSSEKGRTRLITYKDSAGAPPQVARSEHRHHHHHDHSTPQAKAECRRCLRKQKKREEREREREREEAAERTEEEREVRAAGAKREVSPPPARARRASVRRDAAPPAPVQRRSSVRRQVEVPPPPGLPPERERTEKPPEKKKQRPVLGFVIEKKPEKLVTCVTCMEDDVPQKEAAKLACGHWFCHECLKRLFNLSLTDPAHMPPKCCTDDHIPLHHVDKLLSYQFKKQWNKKYLEYTTANRIYCPATDCGEWIQPKDIHNNVGKCSRCKTKVCAMCNGKAHGDDECPKDEDLQKFIETAKNSKFQRCHNCRAMVELEKGCNHMTCRCTAEFCYACGAKWKTCGCPWFNYEPEDEDAELPNNWNNLAAILARQERRERRRAEQLREDEDLARRLAREINPLAPVPGAAGWELPHPANEEQQQQPYGLRDVITLGANIRNYIAAGVAIAANAATAPVPAPPREEPERPRQEQRREPSPPQQQQQQQQRLERRATEPAPRRRTPEQERRPRDPAPAPAPERPRDRERERERTTAHITPPRAASRRRPVHVPPPPNLQSPYLSTAQQAHIERFLQHLDMDDPEPAVETPFGGIPSPTTTNSSSSPPLGVGRRNSGMRRAQTEPRTFVGDQERERERERRNLLLSRGGGGGVVVAGTGVAGVDLSGRFVSEFARFSPYGEGGARGSLAEMGWGWVTAAAAAGGGAGERRRR